MKKIITLMLSLSVILIGIQCSDENNVKKPNTQQNVDFKFNVDGVDKIVKGAFLFDPSFKTFELVSNEMIVVRAKDSATGKEVYVYTVKSASTHANGRVEWENKVGYYGYFEGCFYWGRLIVDDLGNDIFVLGNQAQNPPICPGGQWALETPPLPRCVGCNPPF